MDGNDNHLKGRRIAKNIALAIIALSLTLVTIAAALALSITAPVSVSEGQSITVFAAGTGTVSIFREGNLVSSGVGSASDTWPTNSSDAGLVHYAFSDASQNDTRTITVIDVPLALNVLSPTTDVAASQVAFGITTNWEPELCYVNVDGTGHSLFETAPKMFNASFNVADGVHTLDFKCKLGDELATVTRALHVDTTPPKLTGVSPSGDVTGPYVTMSIDTDEIAQCRYGDADAQFDALPQTFSATFATRNTVTLQATQNGPYTYFVRCQDVYGNKMQTSVIVSFVNKLPPVASIVVDGVEPLKAGTFPLTLTTNVALASAPTLSYTLQETGKSQQIPLTGSDAKWTGYLIIPEDTPDTVVSFSFNGMSRDNVGGTQIAEGSLLTIDAKAPDPVEAITVDNSSSFIRLRWYMQKTDDVASYNIYRAGHEGVSYTDYYASTSSTEFVDAAAHGARYYYYRVAPVDRAGNIGQLSQEVYGSSVDEQMKGQTASPDAAVLQARLDEEIAAVNTALLDANSTISKLESEPNPTSGRIIRDMHLLDWAHDAFSLIDSQMQTLQNLRGGSPTVEEVGAAITLSRATIGNARHKLITKVVPQDITETTQVTDASGLERATPYALVGKNVTGSSRDAFFKSAMAVQDKVTVSLYASTFTLYDASASQQAYTYILKKVKLQDPLNDAKIVESIPKSIASDASEITFGDSPTILEADPVVGYSYPVLEQQEYSYYVKKMVSLEDVKSSRTFVYPPLPVTATKPDDLATGQATRIDLPFIPSTDKLLVIIGVIIIAGLGAYYVSLTSDKPFRGLPAVKADKVSNRVAPILRSPVRIMPISRPLVVKTAIASATASQSVSATAIPTSLSTEQLMHDAEAAIDNKDYDAALLLYRDALKRLETDEGLARILREQTGRLYVKLLLFKRVTDANNAAKDKDAKHLRSLLSEVQKLAASVGEENTTLISEAKSSYADLARQLNTLEIARTEGY